MGILQSFLDGWQHNQTAANTNDLNDVDSHATALIREARAMREDMPDHALDKMIADSFPASDPPSTY